MFTSNDSIKFMVAKIFFNLAEFSYKQIKKATISQSHGIDTLQFFYIQKGKGKIIIDGTEYEMENGTYFSIPPFVKYNINPDEETSYFSVYFVLNLASAYDRYKFLLNKVIINKDDSFSNIFNNMMNEFREKKLGYNEIVVSLFKILFISIVRNENVTGPRLSHWDLDNLQYKIEKIMLENFKTITLKELASKCYLSERELQRYLEKNYNKNFSDLKNDAKMSFAQNLLLSSNMSILEIAYETGYSSSEHFSNAFKKYYGKSPLKYKKETNANH